MLSMDMEVVLFIAFHIDHPCEVEVAPNEVKNIRYFYLREARRMIEIFTNDNAKKFLETKIKEYEN